MYNKHTNTKTDFKVIIENRICISFNTDKKRNEFIAKLKGTREITCITNSLYPWNHDDGIHNLILPSEFAKQIGMKDVDRIKRAIRNKKIKTEKVGNEDCIVEKYGHYYINGAIYYKE